MLAHNTETGIREVKERFRAADETDSMVLSAIDSRIFLESLERDFEPSEALLALKNSHDALRIVDRT